MNPTFQNFKSHFLITVTLLSFTYLEGQKMDTVAFDDFFRKSFSYYGQPMVFAQYTDSLYWYAQDLNDQKRVAVALKLKGVSTFQRSLFDSSLYYYNEGLKINQFLKDSLEIAKAYINLATSYNATFQFEPAIENALRAEKIFVLIDDPVGLGRVYNIVGQMYFHRDDHETAINYFQKHYQISLIRVDTMEIVTALNNIGSSNLDLNKPDSALAYFKSVLEIAKKIHLPGIGATYQNVGMAYAFLNQYSRSNDYYHLAEDYYLKNDDVYRQSEIYLNIGLNYKSLGKLNLAKEYIIKAIDVSKQTSHKISHKKALVTLSSLNAETNNFKNAYESLLSSITVSDEILNEENQKNIAELQARYDTERKEEQIKYQALEIESQKATNSRNTILILALSLSIAFLIIIGLLLKNRLRKKQQLLLQKKDLEYKELQISAVIDSQEKERKRFATDLHDGFGQLISILKLNVESIEQQNDQKKRHALFEKSTTVLNDMYAELRNICFNLMPQSLVKFGLVPSLKEFADKINASEKMTVEVLAFDMEKRLSDLHEISIYRITQEWVNNILKYGDADRVTLQITKDETEVTLTIEDNGTGFEIEKLSQSKGNGWKNIRSRANLIHADIEVDTTPGIRGNTLIINAPITANIDRIKNEKEFS